jgi:transporter family-2 protein
MRLFSLLPALLGVAAVLQGGLNRQISGHWGLAAAALFNTLVLLAAVGGLLVWSRLHPETLPAFFQLKGGLAQIRWWWVLPGLCGFALVAGIPWAISRLGAFPVFLGILGGQLVMSLAWDAFVERRPVTLVRLAGAGLAILGAWLVGRQSP